MSRTAPAFAITDNLKEHRFEADLGHGTFASADYERIAGKILFTHTHVPASHEGQGIGSALVRFALKEARDRKLKVIPICPFFAAYIKNHLEEQDLLDPSYRTTSGLSE